MGNYEELKNALKGVIKPNGNQEITGQVMQDALISMIANIGKYATFAGVAEPSTAPGVIDQNVFYIASATGLYPNFAGAEVNGTVKIFENSTGDWVAIDTEIPNTDYVIDAINTAIARMSEKWETQRFGEVEAGTISIIAQSIAEIVPPERVVFYQDRFVFVKDGIKLDYYANALNGADYNDGAKARTKTYFIDLAGHQYFFDGAKLVELSVNTVQEGGISTTEVMSQKAVSDYYGNDITLGVGYVDGSPEEAIKIFPTETPTESKWNVVFPDSEINFYRTRGNGADRILGTCKQFKGKTESERTFSFVSLKALVLKLTDWTFYLKQYDEPLAVDEVYAFGAREHAGTICPWGILVPSYFYGRLNELQTTTVKKSDVVNELGTGAGSETKPIAQQVVSEEIGGAKKNIGELYNKIGIAQEFHITEGYMYHFFKSIKGSGYITITSNKDHSSVLTVFVKNSPSESSYITVGQADGKNGQVTRLRILPEYGNYIKIYSSDGKTDVTLECTMDGDVENLKKDVANNKQKVGEIEERIGINSETITIKNYGWYKYKETNLAGRLKIVSNKQHTKEVTIYLKQQSDSPDSITLGTANGDLNAVTYFDLPADSQNYIKGYVADGVDFSVEFSSTPLDVNVRWVEEERRKNTFRETLPFNGMGLLRNPSELKILTIGNSFTQDAYTYILDIIKADNIAQNVTLARTFYPGETLAGEVYKFDNKIAKYGFSISEKGGAWQNIYEQNGQGTVENLATIQYALDYADWDIIVLQQGSISCGLIKSYEGSLIPLIQRIRAYSKNTGAKIAFHLTWASSARGTGQDRLDQYGGTQMGMFNALVNVSKELKSMFDFDLIIPSYTAFQNARNNTTLVSSIDDLTISDGLHANNFGQYIASCCYYNTIIAPCFNKSIKDNGYRNSFITDSNFKALQECVINSNAYINQIK